MLLRFGVSNSRSICDYQELLLVASSLKEHQTQVMTVNRLNAKVLPTIGISGANASGKSNLLQAFAFMWRMLLKSYTNGSATGGIARTPFQLDSEVLKGKNLSDIYRYQQIFCKT